MVGIKLDELKAEILKYIGIPYFKNSQGRGAGLDAVMVGKGTAEEIALKTIEFANQENLKLIDFTPQQIYNFQKKHDIGIDCSGLVYNLLKFIKPEVDELLIGTEGKKGVRRLSANLLTSEINSVPVEAYDQIHTADLIRLDGGKHVIFIIEKLPGAISYVHSSDRTEIRGVHFGVIDLNDPKQPLNQQNWSDLTRDGQNYAELFNPENGDGIFRLKYLL